MRYREGHTYPGKKRNIRSLHSVYWYQFQFQLVSLQVTGLSDTDYGPQRLHVSLLAKYSPSYGTH